MAKHVERRFLNTTAFVEMLDLCLYGTLAKRCTIGSAEQTIISFSPTICNVFPKHLCQFLGHWNEILVERLSRVNVQFLEKFLKSVTAPASFDVACVSSNR